jgi:ornithine cyclodeaminase/alanine dehydrogenase-like protein (mu-crystallin family)
MKNQIFDAAQVRAAVLLDRSTLEVVRAGLVGLVGGEITQFPMETQHEGDVEYHRKGGHLQGSPVSVWKWSTENHRTGEVNGGFGIHDANSGELVADFRDGGYLTDLRTVLVIAAVMEGPFRSGPNRKVAVIGSGIIARETLSALALVESVGDITVYGRNPEKLQTLLREMTPDVQDGGRSLRGSSTVRDAVRDADVVITATTATLHDPPLVTLDMLSHGALVIAMGAGARGQRELHPDVVTVAAADGALYADDPRQCAEVGELQHAPELVERCAFVGSRLSGEGGRPGGDPRVTVVDSSGVGAVDAAIGTFAADRLGLVPERPHGWHFE